MIEYQVDEQAGAMIANSYRQAHIPVVAVNNPHPGATYFGANNYEAGLIGGRYLGKWARAHWAGQVDEILMLALNRAGVIPKTRLSGMVQGIREVLGAGSEKIPVVYLDGRSEFEASWNVVRTYLRNGGRGRTLIGAMNDNSGLGALRAYEEAGATKTAPLWAKMDHLRRVMNCARSAAASSVRSHIFPKNMARVFCAWLWIY